MHVPCPNCHTGWLMPDPGEDHLRRCPVCGGTGYITAQFGRRKEDESRERTEETARA